MTTGVATAVGVGGAVGTLARYGLSVEFPVGAAQFPWTTLGINLAGSLALGVVLSIAVDRPPARLLRPLLAVGLLGGFTTFSTVAVEIVQRAEHHPATATAYLAASVVGGPLAVLGGASATRRFSLSRRVP